MERNIYWAVYKAFNAVLHGAQITRTKPFESCTDKINLIYLKYLNKRSGAMLDILTAGGVQQINFYCCPNIEKE